MILLRVVGLFFLMFSFGMIILLMFLQTVLIKSKKVKLLGYFGMVVVSIMALIVCNSWFQGILSLL